MQLKKKIAILGAGNIGSAIAEGLVQSKIISPSNIAVTRKNKRLLKEFTKRGFNATNNVEAVKLSDIIILAVTPQKLNELVEEIKVILNSKKHTIISIVSGVSINQIKKHLGLNISVIRVMPNTAIAIQESMTCISANESDKEALKDALKIFDVLGKTIVIEESLMVPATALCACGTAFFLRAIRAASQGGIEIGFHAADALFMAAQTAKGSSAMLLKKGKHPENEVDKVTTPMGCTISGLNQMEHYGFSSSLIKGIITSAEKAGTLYANND
jgi:pyrroline-5-carboxylate reductase